MKTYLDEEMKNESSNPTAGCTLIKPLPYKRLWIRHFHTYRVIAAVADRVVP